MSCDPRIAIVFCAHVLVTGCSLWLVAASSWPLSTRSVLGVFVAAALLPWLPALAAQHHRRRTGLALLLVVVIGVGIVEVLATGAQWRATLLLGSAMLEFAVLLSLSHGRSEREASEPAQR